MLDGAQRHGQTVSVELQVPDVGSTPVLHRNRLAWSKVRPHWSHTALAGSEPIDKVPQMCWLLANTPSLLGRRLVPPISLAMSSKSRFERSWPRFVYSSIA